MQQEESEDIGSVARQVYTSLGLQTELAYAYLEEALRLAQLFDKKQQDYGSHNIGKFGEKGVLVRVNDKVERLTNLLWHNPGKSPNNESLSDTWDDIHVYGVIGRLCRDGKWK